MNDDVKTISILYINNDGGGFAEYVDAPEGQTIGEFFSARIGGESEKSMIRVNRQPVAKDYVLQPRDRVTLTPMNIKAG